MHPTVFYLLGFKFNGSWYYTKGMMMGHVVSSEGFETFSTFLEWVLKDRTGSLCLTHYLDDYLIAGLGRSSVCTNRMPARKDMAGQFGILLG